MDPSPKPLLRAGGLVRRSAAIVVSTLLVACSSSPPRSADVPDVQHTWEQARVYLPERQFAVTPAQVQRVQRAPIVIYLHGCTGLANHDAQWARTLAGNNFVVVQPDSFARSNRRANCDPLTHRVGLFPSAAAMRDEELRFALARLREVSWADPERIFVMGHSEGGRAAMTNVLPDVRGTIVSGWGCTSTNRRWVGIPHPADHPLLILEHDNDPWYVARGGRCKDHLQGRTATRHVTLGSGGHGSAQSALARRATLEFLAGLRER